MLYLLLLINFKLVHFCTADGFIAEQQEIVVPKMEIYSGLPDEMSELTKSKDIEYILEEIEQKAALVANSRKENTLSDIEEKYDDIVETLEELIQLLKVPENANKFLSTKGIDRIVALIAGINNERLKKHFLIVIKTLFNVDPATTTALIPARVVDKLLDIFEHDENLAIKTHALDIMSVWLPNNPQIQARVMKMKGLEPFYDQVSKLDAGVIFTLLDLFNKILEEHVTIRSDKSVTNKDDFIRKLYQKIGLIERMSTPQVCNGLLNIFELILPSHENGEQFSKLIINLMKNIKPFCLRIYRNKSRPIRIFTALKNYFTNSNRIDLIAEFGFNSTEVRMLLEDYTKKINENSRDEF